MHLKRWLTGIVAVPIIYLIISTGGFWFVTFIAIVSGLTLWEFFNIVLSSKRSPAGIAIPIIAYVTSTVIIFCAYYINQINISGLIAANLLVTAVLTLPLFKSDANAPFIAVKQIFGITYIPFFLSFLVVIRIGENGAYWIYLILCIIAAGDTGAFYVGSYFGKRKLCPSVSPKKTIEGAGGGLISNMVVAILFKLFLMPFLPFFPTLLFAVAIGAAGQAGDLFESEFKRAAGVKDSSALLPGHGGFLDRIDALLFASPVAYFIKSAIL